MAVSRVLRLCRTCCLPRTSGNVRLRGRGRSARALGSPQCAEAARTRGSRGCAGEPQVVPRALLGPQVPGLATIQNLWCRGLSPLGLLALLGVRVHWPEFWGSGRCSPVVNASAITGVGWAVASELKGPSDPTLNFVPTAKVGGSEACRNSA